MTAPARKGDATDELASEQLGAGVPLPAADAGAAVVSTSTTGTLPPFAQEEPRVDLGQRRDELRARFAELQCDLGGLTYEMAIRNHIRVEVLVRKAAALQDVDAELSEVERILHLEETGTAGACGSCGAPHSSGAVYCWQCGQPLLEYVSSDALG